MINSQSCIFCEIIADISPAKFHYRSEDFVVFENNLNWLPTQLLIVPTNHLTQYELWNSGVLLSKMGKYANDLGEKLCPNGYRILSNFGDDGMQSQPHAHLHLLGGRKLSWPPG